MLSFECCHRKVLSIVEVTKDNTRRLILWGHCGACFKFLASFHQASDSQLSMGSLGQLSHWVERAMGMTSEGEQMDSMADESQERQQFEVFFVWMPVSVS